MSQKGKALVIESTYQKTYKNRGHNMRIKYNKVKIDFKDLNREITPYTLQLLRQLLPEGILENREYVALNPTRHDRNLGSFRINIFTGKWADFATGDKGGDFISLFAYVKGISQTEAALAVQAIVRGA